MNAEAGAEESVDASELTALLRLHVVADADPGALMRVLESFQMLNAIPRRVVAEVASPDRLYVSIDITGLSELRLSLIAAKLGQVPSIVSASWHRT